MVFAMACPCTGPSSNVRRINRSRVPCNSSMRFLSSLVDILGKNKTSFSRMSRGEQALLMEFDFPESHQTARTSPLAIPTCSRVHTLPNSSFYLLINHLPIRLPPSPEPPTLPCSRESPSHPPGAKDHVSGILDSSAERSSGEVVAENWNSVPHGRWSLPDRRACETSVQRLVSVVRYSQAGFTG